ncbi:MAG: hypothetical protein CMJ46_02320 [Planctomyces sp.]|nr:hypothetical protein [Planctomyces sp.]
MSGLFETTGRLTAETIQPESRVVILPAAGVSARMGEHKLSLPLGESTLLGTVLANYLAAEVDLILIVRRPDDESLPALLPESDRLLLVTPAAPPADMKASIQYALAALRSLTPATEAITYLLSPPDMPFLTPDIINELLSHWSPEMDVLIPTTAGRRGHPVLFSDRVARRVDGLPEDRGLNSLWEDPELHLREFELEKSGILFDIDTPDDYANALDRVRNSPF